MRTEEHEVRELSRMRGLNAQISRMILIDLQEPRHDECRTHTGSDYTSPCGSDYKDLGLPVVSISCDVPSPLRLSTSFTDQP